MLCILTTPAIPGSATLCQDPATSHGIRLVQVLDYFAALKHRGAGVGILYVRDLHKSSCQGEVQATEATDLIPTSSSLPHMCTLAGTVHAAGKPVDEDGPEE